MNECSQEIFREWLSALFFASKRNDFRSLEPFFEPFLQSTIELSKNASFGLKRLRYYHTLRSYLTANGYRVRAVGVDFIKKLSEFPVLHDKKECEELAEVVVLILSMVICVPINLSKLPKYVNEDVKDLENRGVLYV